MRFFKRKTDKRGSIPFCDLKCRIAGMASPKHEEIFPTCVATAVHPGGEEVQTVLAYRTAAEEKAFQAELLKKAKSKKKVQPKAKVKAKPIAKKSKPKPRSKPDEKVHKKVKRGKTAR